MDAWQLSPDAVRLVAALAGLGLALAVERLRPFRGRVARRRRRELRNVALWAIGAGLLQVLPLATALGAGEVARRADVGLLNQLALPAWAAVGATFLVLDVWTYLMHRLYHRVPLLWRLHRVHHSDPSLTATTGVRFHPGEILLSALARVPVVVALGASATGIVAFEIALLAASQLQHADVRLPDRAERLLGALLITPNLHRTHHSVLWREADSNFGTLASAWDRALGTLRRVEPEGVVVGAPDATPPDASLAGLLALPFRRVAAPSPRAAPAGVHSWRKQREEACQPVSPSSSRPRSPSPSPVSTPRVAGPGSTSRGSWWRVSPRTGRSRTTTTRSR